MVTWPRSKRFEVFNPRETRDSYNISFGKNERKNKMKEPSRKERKGMLRGQRRALYLGRHGKDRGDGSD